MLLSFNCPSCNKEIQTEDQYLGEWAECPFCSTVQVVADPPLASDIDYCGFTVSRVVASNLLWTSYLAETPEDSENVILKVPSVFIRKHASDFDNLANAVIRAGTLNLPQYATLIDRTLNPETPCFVFNLLADSRNIKDLIRINGSIDSRDALEMIRSIASAMNEAWKKHNVLHLNLLPENINVSPDFEVEIFGMGVSEFLLKDTGLIDYGFNIWQEQYSCPELFTEASRSGPAADIYSLGAVFYLMLTGEAPFKDIDPEKIPEQPVPDPRKVDSSVPESCYSLLKDMMAQMPMERCENWNVVIEHIDSLLNNDERVVKPVAAPIIQHQVQVGKVDKHAVGKKTNKISLTKEYNFSQQKAEKFVPTGHQAPEKTQRKIQVELKNLRKTKKKRKRSSNETVARVVSKDVFSDINKKPRSINKSLVIALIVGAFLLIPLFALILILSASNSGKNKNVKSSGRVEEEVASVEKDASEKPKSGEKVGKENAVLLGKIKAAENYKESNKDDFEGLIEKYEEVIAEAIKVSKFDLADSYKKKILKAEKQLEDKNRNVFGDLRCHINPLISSKKFEEAESYLSKQLEDNTEKSVKREIKKLFVKVLEKKLKDQAEKLLLTGANQKAFNLLKNYDGPYSEESKVFREREANAMVESEISKKLKVLIDQKKYSEAATYLKHYDGENVKASKQFRESLLAKLDKMRSSSAEKDFVREVEILNKNFKYREALEYLKNYNGELSPSAARERERLIKGFTERIDLVERKITPILKEIAPLAIKLEIDQALRIVRQEKSINFLKNVKLILGLIIRNLEKYQNRDKIISEALSASKGQIIEVKLKKRSPQQIVIIKEVDGKYYYQDPNSKSKKSSEKQNYFLLKQLALVSQLDLLDPKDTPSTLLCRALFCLDKGRIKKAKEYFEKMPFDSSSFFTNPLLEVEAKNDLNRIMKNLDRNFSKKDRETLLLELSKKSIPKKRAKEILSQLDVFKIKYRETELAKSETHLIETISSLCRRGGVKRGENQRLDKEKIIAEDGPALKKLLEDSPPYTEIHLKSGDYKLKGNPNFTVNQKGISIIGDSETVFMNGLEILSDKVRLENINQVKGGFSANKASKLIVKNCNFYGGKNQLRDCDDFEFDNCLIKGLGIELSKNIKFTHCDILDSKDNRMQDAALWLLKESEVEVDSSIVFSRKYAALFDIECDPKNIKVSNSLWFGEDGLAVSMKDGDIIEKSIVKKKSRLRRFCRPKTNIYAPPLFVNPPNGDFNLTKGASGSGKAKDGENCGVLWRVGQILPSGRDDDQKDN